MHVSRAASIDTSLLTLTPHKYYKYFINYPPLQRELSSSANPQPVVGFIYIDAKPRETSFPNEFTENPI